MSALPYILAILRFLFLYVAVNAIPIFGLASGGWSGATALTVYWIENAFGSVLVAARILVHERLTHKRGHYRAQINTTIRTTSNGHTTERKSTKQGSFFSEFLVSSLVFTLAHGFFLGAFLAIALKVSPDWEQVSRAAVSIAGLQIVAFMLDLVTIRSRPFAWIKRLAGVTLGRVILLHLAIVFGVGVAALSGQDRLFYLPFAGLKLLVDLLSGLPEPKDPYSSPGWLSKIMRHFKPSKLAGDYDNWDDYIAGERKKDLARDAEDEQTVGGQAPG